MEIIHTVIDLNVVSIDDQMRLILLAHVDSRVRAFYICSENHLHVEMNERDAREIFTDRPEVLFMRYVPRDDEQYEMN